MNAAAAIAVVISLAACAQTPPPHVEILPLPSPTASTSTTAIGEAPEEDGPCKPNALVAIGADTAGALDTGELRRVLASSMDFAKRCCNGDEDEDATVLVTVSPEGYSTSVSIEPQSGSASGACLYATFHRVMTKPFHGDPLTVRVPIHLRKE